MKRQIRRKTADLTLPRDLSSRIVDALTSAFANDPSPKGRIQEKSFLQKFCSEETDPAELRRDRAIEKWLDTERTNQRTNRRLADPESLTFLWRERVTYGRLVATVRNVVSQVIGTEPSYSPLHCGFSGGATTSRKRDDGHPAIKFLDKADVTRPCLDVFRNVIRGTAWERSIDEVGLDIRFVPGNTLFTVPKNATIDRVAAKEPDLNIFLQKGLGNQIRWALKRVGQDLNDQTVNGELARCGSVDGSLMTLDLSAASDSMTIELVRLLLPSSWYMYLDQVRSPTTLVRGEIHRCEMFSSMGNGFTFELESLLFYATCKAVAYLSGVRGRISVYGDDIIAPSVMYEDLVRALSFLGFTVNHTKSFHEGPFRESCGAYWHAGVNVKPFFLRKPVRQVSDLILLLNGLTRWATLDCGVVDLDYERLFLQFRDFVPEELWGGQDFASRSSLVTGHAPRKELVPVVSERRLPDRGKLLLWLLTFEGRRTASESEAISANRQSGLSRLRRSKQVKTDVPLFLITWDREHDIEEASPGQGAQLS